jgi:hypothetical protein
MKNYVLECRMDKGLLGICTNGILISNEKKEG